MRAYAFPAAAARLLCLWQRENGVGNVKHAEAAHYTLMWLVGWLAGWWVDWLVGWLTGRLVDRSTFRFIDWLVSCLDGWLVGWLICCWLVGWMVDLLLAIPFTFSPLGPFNWALAVSD